MPGSAYLHVGTVDTPFWFPKVTAECLVFIINIIFFFSKSAVGISWVRDHLSNEIEKLEGVEYVTYERNICLWYIIIQRGVHTDAVYQQHICTTSRITRSYVRVQGVPDLFEKCIFFSVVFNIISRGRTKTSLVYSSTQRAP